MNHKYNIIKGTLILTITGVITRLIGFVYRIFLSRVFGEERMGIYQLIFPIYTLGFSLSCAGIETAISRTVAQKKATGKLTQAKTVLFTGCLISLSLSMIFVFMIHKESTYIAVQLLNEPRCQSLLVILSYALPFSSIHSCIYGYFLGLRETKTPALSQIIEQAVRVGSVLFLYQLNALSSSSPDITIAVAGIVFGELASSLFCYFSYRRQHFKTKNIRSFSNIIASAKDLLYLSVSLTGNRVLLNLLSSIEAISIPSRLQLFGYNVSQALSIYGVLTGMALPCILFPSALTNSIAQMTLPTVAEIQVSSGKSFLYSFVKKITLFCFFLGIICCILFIVTGSFIGTFIFHSNMTGDFLITLAWMCPFLYTNNNLISIINGLGKTMYSFIFNSLGFTIRIASIYLLIPIYGIRGYLTGLLISHTIIFLLCIFYLYLVYKKKIAS